MIEEDNGKLDPPQLWRIYKDEVDCVGIDIIRLIGKSKAKQKSIDEGE